MRINKFILGMILVSILFVSCSGDDDNNRAPRGDYDNGLIIINEGNFFSGNASATYVSQDLTTVEQGIFTGVNTAPLGDTAQSLTFHEEFAFVVVNVSNKIEVVNRYSFESISTISTGLSNPRYMVIVGNKAYVTNWGDGASTTDDYIAVVDLTTYTVESTIAVAEGPERIVENNGKLFVSHKGGWGLGNSVSVITISNGSIQSIPVDDVPDEMVLANGNLWVLSEGKPAWTGSETGGSIKVINTDTDTVELTFPMGATDHPSLLDFKNNTIFYYMNGDIYKMAHNASTLPTTPIISAINTNTFSASMRVDHSRLYFTDAGDNNSNGSLIVYDLSNNTPVETLTVGINPGGGIYLNEL
ncbi:MAG: YncE family protein [Flavobacteriaceae bacterium]|nr:YncE family protein [Flavobacteriaceae bacterium]